MATEVEVAWAAGLFEGEGCISIHRYSTKKYGVSYQIQLIVASTDLDVLEKFASVVGGGTVSDFDRGKAWTLPHHKKAYQWVLTNRQLIRTVLESFLPHFGMRRMMKCREALEKMDAYDVSRGRVS